jgi:glycosyltransferase involved in cell wall biosynthesis
VGDAVASALDQEPIELVVVDDGSTDQETIARLRELEAQGVAVVRQNNGGLSAARMAGVAATSARYVYPLDADDALAPGALARLADALDDTPEAAVAYGDVEVFGDAHNFYDHRRSQLDPWMLTYLSTIPGTSMVRREALLEAGGWQLNAGGYEDWDLWMGFAERGFRGVYAPGLMLRYRILSGGRMWKQAMETRHDHLYGLLRERHARLFAERRAHRRLSTAPRRAKLLFPLIDAVPGLSLPTKRRFYDLIVLPGHIVIPRLRALARLPQHPVRGWGGA